MAPNLNRPVTIFGGSAATLADGADWNKFVAAHHAHGKARIKVQAAVRGAGHRAGPFTGEFAAVREPAEKTACSESPPTARQPLGSKQATCRCAGHVFQDFLSGTPMP